MEKTTDINDFLTAIQGRVDMWTAELLETDEWRHNPTGWMPTLRHGKVRAKQRMLPVWQDV